MEVQMTITEALAEIRTLNKRIEKKIELISARVGMQGHIKDPFEAEGGTLEANKREMQSIHDLQSRLVAIRSAIHEANTKAVLKIHNLEYTLAQWLVWKREVLPAQKKLITGVSRNINRFVQQVQSQGLTINPDADSDKQVRLTYDVAALEKEADELEQIEGVLDGKLSLLNATTTITLND